MWRSSNPVNSRGLATHEFGQERQWDEGEEALESGEVRYDGALGGVAPTTEEDVLQTRRSVDLDGCLISGKWYASLLTVMNERASIRRPVDDAS